MKLVNSLFAAALLAALGTSASAAGLCTWSCNRVFYNDGEPVQDHESGGIIGWAWYARLDTTPWTINASSGGYSGEWGFSQVAKSANPSNGRWVVHKVSSCDESHEDLEISVQVQFHAEAQLDSDELSQACGVLKFWCDKTKSAGHPPSTVSVLCAGGVRCDDDADPSSTADVEYTLAGVKVKLQVGLGNGQAKTADPHEYDSGKGGRSDEYFNTYTHCQTSIDLDSFDNCQAGVWATKWYVFVLGTCDGECGVRTPIYTRCDFPPAK